MSDPLPMLDAKMIADAIADANRWRWLTRQTTFHASHLIERAGTAYLHVEVDRGIQADFAREAEHV